MSNARFRAGMICAGNICELHVAAVKALQPDVDFVGIADLDTERARANAAQWGTQAFTDLDALVAAGANVIHVLTPAAANAKVAMAAVERGCHVSIENPIVEDPEVAKQLAQLAKQKGVTVSVNHSLRYDPQIKRALDAVTAGAIGQVVSVDIVRGEAYPPYEGGPLPPWYREAGYPFRDLGVHCLHLFQELLGPIEDVQADWRSLGGDPNLAFDESRATVRCARGLAQLELTLSSKPKRSQLTIHGTKGKLRVALFAMGNRSSIPKPAERLVNAFADWIGARIHVPANVDKLVRKDHAQHGPRELVADFYRRLAAGEPTATSVTDAANVGQWVEKVARAADADHEAHQARFQLAERVSYLVTGASGSLGKAIVARLRADGHAVRVFQRRMPSTPQAGVEYAFGNLGDPVAIDRAVKGAEIVIHCGAATKGGWPEHKGGTVVGTQNVIDACTMHGVKQLVHISSMSVIDWAGSAGKGNVTEAAATEPRAGERGAYTRAKLEAEKLVSAAAKHGLPAVVLRPGQIFGGGIPLINGAVARGVGGRWLVLGDGKLELPLVYIDDVVDAVMASIDKQLTRGEIIQIIDPEHLTQEEVLRLAGGTRGVLRVPRAIVFALGRLGEISLGALGKPRSIGVYRLQSALAPLHYESDRAAALLGWQPRVGVREGIRRVTNPAPGVDPATPLPASLRAVSG